MLSDHVICTIIHSYVLVSTLWLVCWQVLMSYLSIKLLSCLLIWVTVWSSDKSTEFYDYILWFMIRIGCLCWNFWVIFILDVHQWHVLKWKSEFTSIYGEKHKLLENDQTKAPFNFVRSVAREEEEKSRSRKIINFNEDLGRSQT